jgi:hypothetical protein
MNDILNETIEKTLLEREVTRSGYMDYIRTQITNKMYTCIKNYISSISLFKFFIICNLISIHKINRIHNVILNDVIYSFIL